VYGYAEKNEPVEIVNAKLRAIGKIKSPKLSKKQIISDSIPNEYRKVFYETDDSWKNVRVYKRNSLGSENLGPAVIEQYDSTILVYPDWKFMPDEFGNLILRRAIYD
jgi:N-methylhydantoinase A